MLKVTVDPAYTPVADDATTRARRYELADAEGARDWFIAEPPRDTAPSDWLICLHGHGSDGSQLYTRPDIRDDWLPDFRRRGMGILSPNLRGNAWMSPRAVLELHALIQWARTHFPVRRFILMGGSMGGTGALIYAVQHPEDLAGVIALCPATDIATYHQWAVDHPQSQPVIPEIVAAIEAAYPPSPGAYPHHRAQLLAERLTMPLFFAHGDNDCHIPVSQSRQLWERLQALGRRNAHYIEQANGGHDTPLRLGRDALQWVYQQIGEVAHG